MMKTVECWYCGKTCAVTSGGYIWKHNDPRIPVYFTNRNCEGSGTKPDMRRLRRLKSALASEV